MPPSVRKVAFLSFVFYMFSIQVANPKYTRSATASMQVVMKGLAVTAGSSPILFARMGREQPMNFAQITTTASVRHITAATVTVRPGVLMMRISKRYNFMKFTTERVMAHISETRNSFHITLKTSMKCMSPSESPLMMVTDACEPQLPPVPISIGMYAVKITRADSFFSNDEMIILVKVADIIRIRSQGKRAFHIEKML